jgi:hypothetical protein
MKFLKFAVETFASISGNNCSILIEILEMEQLLNSSQTVIMLPYASS